MHREASYSYTATKGICKASSCAASSPMSAGRRIQGVFNCTQTRHRCTSAHLLSLSSDLSDSLDHSPNAFALAQGLPENSVAFGTVAESRSQAEELYQDDEYVMLLAEAHGLLELGKHAWTAEQRARFRVLSTRITSLEAASSSTPGRRKTKRRRKKLPKSGRRLLPLSAWCLVREWIHVHEEVCANLDIFSANPLFLARTFPLFLRQSVAALGSISHILYVVSNRTRLVCSQVRAARSLTMCLPLVRH